MSFGPAGERLIRFDSFVLALESGELRLHGRLVKIQAQPFKLLVLLALRSSRVVTREEIQRELWNEDTVVDFDKGIYYCIKEIRRALGDDPEKPSYIQTLPGKGYRFVAPVEIVEPSQPAVEGNLRGNLLRAGVPAGVAVIASLVLLRVAGMWDRIVGESGPNIDSVAVLPMENLSGDPDQEYFADGMTDELINQLAQLSALKVISRTSVMQYKQARKPLPEIAKELGVEAVVEATVKRSGDRVRITAQLIEAATDRHLWAESYERDMKDVLALQSELARAIVREIRVTLTPEEEERLARARPVDPEVYEACLKAEFEREHLRPEKAYEYIQEAISKDPNYAPVYSLLADYHLSLRFLSGVSPRDVVPKARAAVRKALELDPMLPDAHLTLASIELSHDWDWSGAEREYRRALELGPGLPKARSAYSLFLSAMQRHEEAMARAQEARQLDPVSLWSRSSVGMAILFAGRYEEAVEHIQETIEMYPSNGSFYVSLGWAYRNLGMHEEAIAALKKAVTLLRESDVVGKVSLAQVYVDVGRTGEAQRVLDELLELEKRQFVSPWWIAGLYDSLGEKEQALQYLEKAYEARDPELFFLRMTCEQGHSFVDLRDDPRFQDLWRRMDFPE